MKASPLPRLDLARDSFQNHVCGGGMQNHAIALLATTRTTKARPTRCPYRSNLEGRS